MAGGEWDALILLSRPLQISSHAVNLIQYWQKIEPVVQRIHQPLAHIIMRKSNVIRLNILILLMLFSCESDTENLDYRSSYVGNFIFSSYSYFWEVSQGTSYTYGDTIVYEGSVQLNEENDSTIIITYRSEGSGGYVCNNIKVYGSQIKPTLLTSGELYYPLITSTCGPHGTFSGGFIGTDSISFNVGGGSLGGSWGHIVTGSRNK